MKLSGLIQHLQKKKIGFLLPSVGTASNPIDRGYNKAITPLLPRNKTPFTNVALPTIP